MMIAKTISRRVLILAVLLALLSVAWLPASVSPVAAEEPAELTIKIVPVEAEFGINAIGSPPVFEVGEVFKVSIVAENVESPGIFGSQFEIGFDSVHLQVVEGSLVSGSMMEPVVNPVNEVDNVAGLIRYAASRQGDLDNLMGSVELATLSFEAIAATEPPEGQTTTIDLLEAKLGAKGGIEVPVMGLVDLDVIIRDEVIGDGDIVGNVKVEGRMADNQAGHAVVAEGTSGELSALTDANGDFMIEDAPADTYSVMANSAGFLAATCTGVEHLADMVTSLADVTLLAGDINDDGVIDITDAVAIGAVFGSTEPAEVADLNVDGVVDILDLILMSVNFEQTSEGNPWLCVPATEL